MNEEMGQGDVTAVLARLDERTEGMAKKLDQVAHVLLEGNGVPAVTVQVATLNEKVSHLEGLARDYRIPRHVWMGIVVSAVVGVAGILVSLAALKII